MLRKVTLRKVMGDRMISAGLHRQQLPAGGSERVHVDEQTVDLVLRKRAVEGGHVAAAGEDDFGYALVIGREAAFG